jgi:hypothetical protein
MLSLESKSDRWAGSTEVSQRLRVVALIFLWHHHDISWGFIRFKKVRVVPTKMLLGAASVTATEDRELAFALKCPQYEERCHQ